MLFKKSTNKIFCISTQRTGTTSVGQFFKNNDYTVADWFVSNKNNWSYYWNIGDFETIFNSKDFKNSQVFEDDPWWLPEFYKVLFHRFPGAKFILFTRDSEAWFQSMVKHSEGKILGNTMKHCKVYRRESEFIKLFNEQERLDYDEKKIDNLLSLENKKEHYIDLYNQRNTEMVDFFKKHSPDSLFVSSLEDDQKWVKLGAFMDIKVSKDFNVHVNRSNNL